MDTKITTKTMRTAIVGKLSRFFSEINNFYLNEPCLYGDDDGWDGFEWLLADDSDNNVLSYKRRLGGEELICIINFSGSEKDVSLHLNGKYKLAFNSDMIRFGGDAINKKRVVKSKNGEVSIKLNQLSFVYLKKQK